MNQDHKKLHEKFSTLGRERNRLTYELLAMLPRIYDEGIYREHKCATIYEYAGRYAGLSHSVVEKTLKLHRELEGKPCLLAAIRTQGVHKVALVARLATSETDEVLAKRVVDMSRPALIELSKELRRKVEVNQVTIEQFTAERIGRPGDDGTVNPRLCRAAQESMTIALDPEMQFMFLKLKKRFEKSLCVNLSNKQGLRLMLEELGGMADVWSRRSREMKADTEDSAAGSSARQRKGDVVKKFPGKKLDESAELLCNDMAKVCDRSEVGASSGKEKVKGAGIGIIAEYVAGVRAGVKKVDADIFQRYIPVKIRRLAIAKTAGGCAYPGCNRPFENFHHRARFGDGGTHDSIVPICGTHHEFAHNGLVWRELAEVREWELDLVESGNGSFIDKMCIEHRMVARKGG